MSIEEASQEVRRILRQNDVEETLRYLSTVTRSIEANQHDLRAIIGNSYRDLLAACDGVVGMENDCADILTIESALESAAAAAQQRSATGSAADVAPTLTAEWFAARRKRRRHITDGKSSSSAAAATAAEKQSTAVGEKERTKSGSTAKKGGGADSATATLPTVVLPLPPPSKPRQEKTPSATGHAEERIWLDDELQALHLHYMGVASAVKAQDGDGTDLDAVFGQQSSSISISSPANAADAAVAPFLRGLPLLRLARRLQRVQEVLSALRRGAAATVGTAASVPEWVNSFHRRATTLETRLVKLLLTRLRRAADAHAQLTSQCAALEREKKRASALAPTPAVPGSPLTSVRVDGMSAADSGEQELRQRGLLLAERRQAIRVCTLFAECHGVMRALSGSTTLLGALVAYAPGVHLPRGQQSAADAPGMAPASSDLLGIASLTNSADPLFAVATRDARQVLASILDHPQQASLSGRAAPLHLVLALLTVLLLREAQVSAARWSAVMSAAAAHQQQLVTHNNGGADGKVRKAIVSTPTRTFANAAFLSSLGLSGSPAAQRAGNVARAATVPATSSSTSDGGSNTAWALRCFSGLSFLFRNFADYVDLLQPTSASGNTPSTTATAATAEVRILRALQRVWASTEDYDVPEKCSGSGDADNDGVTWRTEAQSLEELLEWRLRRRGSGVRGGLDSVGTPSPLMPRTSLPGSPLGDTRGSAPSSPSPLRVKAVDGVASATATPARQSSAMSPTFAAAVEGGGGGGGSAGASSAVRRRGYVEALRASLCTVPELQPTGTPSPAAQSRVQSAVGREADSEAAALPAMLPSLEQVGRELLAPLISSLVVLLARDPVTIAVYGDYATVADGVTGSLRAVLLGCNGQQGRLTGAPAERGATDGFLVDASRVGQTWASLNQQRWWEETRQTALREALQRCVTVALQSVSFVENCILRGLVDSTVCEIAVSTKAGETRGDHSATAQWTADGIEQTWAALFDVLSRHALHTGAQVRDGVLLAGDSDKAAAQPAVATDEQTPQKNKPQLSNTVSSLSTPARHAAGVVSAAAGICWDRLRPSAAAAAPPAHGGGARGPAAGSMATMQDAGDGVFREEGLEWGQTALRSAELPLSLLLPQGSSGCGDDATPALCSEDQQRLVEMLSGFHSLLFVRWHGPAGVDEVDAVATSLNGHAAELLQRCLLTLVTAVKAYGGAPSSSFQGSSSDAAAPPVSLHTRVVLWLKDALCRVEERLDVLSPASSADAQTHSPASIIHSYELSLILRVYDTVLRRLAAAPQGSERAVQELCAQVQQLSRRAQLPWQDALLAFYKSSLHQVYVERGSAVGTGRGLQVAGPASSSSWIRAAAVGAGSGSGARGIAYPAQPTPAVTILVESTLRLLHQALTGTATVYESRGTQAVGGGGGDGSRSGTTTAGRAAPGVVHELVSAGERQHIIHQIAEATAHLFTRELLPLLSPTASTSSANGLAAGVAATVVGGTQGGADDVRLQWLMDVLFVSSVWCTEVCSTQATLFTSPTGAAATSQTDAVTPYVAPGPLQGVVVTLERSCDPIRWRSAAPLVLAAFRQFLSASAALWVIRHEAEHSNSGSTSGAVKAEEGCSLAAVAAAKPLLSGSAGVAGMPASSSERLLQPRERVDRLALLPIAISSAAATAASLGGVGGGSVGPPAAMLAAPAFSGFAPTAAALHPYMAGPAAAAGGGGATVGSAGYRWTGAPGMPPHSGLGAAGLYDGAYTNSGAYSAGTGAVPVPGGVLGAAAANAGVGASSAAAAASSLWGTTQRGWNQLWGSN